MSKCKDCDGLGAVSKRTHTIGNKSITLDLGMIYVCETCNGTGKEHLEEKTEKVSPNQG